MRSATEGAATGPAAAHEIVFDELLETWERIRPRIHRTPVLRSRALDERCGRRVLLKCECFQRAGSFKIRGAMASLSALGPEELERGVVTHSSGNHAQAVALAASTFGARADVVMPRDAPEAKRRATEAYGGVVTLCEPTLAARESTSREILERTGGVLVHPFDQANTIRGQSTVALELLDEAPEVEAIVAPISGGGLISGTALAAHGRNPGIRVYGVEPELAAEAAESLRTGRLVERQPGPTIADGLRANVSAANFALLQRHVEDIVVVSDAQILAAMRFLWERLKIVVEPSGATALAGLMEHGETIRGDVVAVLVSGGNLDVGSMIEHAYPSPQGAAERVEEARG